jgi:hypothetical protein
MRWRGLWRFRVLGALGVLGVLGVLGISGEWRVSDVAPCISITQALKS